jgi:hypothetical protein
MDPVMAELIAQLVRNGALDADDISDITGRLHRQGYGDLAHGVNVSFIEASLPSIDEEAEQRRSTIRLVPDGGNADA